MSDSYVIEVSSQTAGIVVRDVRRYPNLQDALHITIGTPEENAKVLAVLNEMTADKGQA